MRLAWLVLLIALAIIALSGCQQAEAPTGTPPPAMIEQANLAVAPSLLTLARNPGAFEGQDLRLVGNYQPLPLPVCAGETHRSPATWALGDGEIQILASGFDDALRELASPGLPLEVEGSWQRWEGPVGCGRRAPSQLVWHLQLTNILSPNPLSASVPFTPGPVDPAETPSSAAALAGDASSPIPLAATPFADNPSTEGIVTPTSGLPETQPPGGTATPIRTTSPNGSATATTVLATAGSGTPSATPQGSTTATTSVGALTPTITSTSGPSPTPTDARPTLLDYDDLSKRTIAAGDLQEWNFAGATDLPIIIRVAPSSRLDVALELLDPSGESLDVYDGAGAGQTEFIDESSLPASGLYTLQVSNIGQSSGSYAVVLQSDSSRPSVEFQGVLVYGETRAGTTPVNGDHLWNLEGVAGDIINIRVAATTSTDMRIYFNNHNGQETEFVNDNSDFFPPEDREEILGLRLPATGLYTIGIGEQDLDSLGYTILIEREP